MKTVRALINKFSGAPKTLGMKKREDMKPEDLAKYDGILIGYHSCASNLLAELPAIEQERDEFARRCINRVTDDCEWTVPHDYPAKVTTAVREDMAREEGAEK